MECEYCGGRLSEPRHIPRFLRAMYQNAEWIRRCKRCGRNYASNEKDGEYTMLRPTI